MSGKAIMLSLLIVSVMTLAQGAAAQNPVVWSGGIGLDERESAPTTGIRLEFFDQTGDFLANVHVVVKDKAGKVIVDTVSPGPWLILKLDSGSYRVRAEVSGKAQGLVIDVAGEGKQKVYGFRFPTTPAG